MSAFDPDSLAQTLAAFPEAPRVWVAYSGGLDSTVLLRAAAAVRERLPGALHAIHINHGLHPDSGLWAEHCREICETLAIPLVVRCLDLDPIAGESLEAVAREARYNAFASLIGSGDLLLTAHNQDDQAETLLLALIRGSGVHGLAAMPAAADLGLGRLVRPLLRVPRAPLEHYARTLGLSWVDDPSNDSLSIDRNYLRNLVLPLVRERWPAVSTTLARSAGLCAESAQLVDLVAAQELLSAAGDRPGTLSIPALCRLAPPLRKAVLRLWLRRRGFALPDAAHLGRILQEVIPARADADPLVAWRGCEVRRYRSDLFALRPLPPIPAAEGLAWVGQSLELPAGLGTLQRGAEPTDGPPFATPAMPAPLDPPDPPDPETWDQASLAPADLPASGPGTWGEPRPLVVRFGVPELLCRAPGSSHARPLKKLFQDTGVPAWLRPYVPLVFHGDQLVAVAGVCPCLTPEFGAGPGLAWMGHPWEGLGFFG